MLRRQLLFLLAQLLLGLEAPPVLGCQLFGALRLGIATCIDDAQTNQPRNQQHHGRRRSAQQRPGALSPRRLGMDAQTMLLHAIAERRRQHRDLLQLRLGQRVVLGALRQHHQIEARIAFVLKRLPIRVVLQGPASPDGSQLRRLAELVRHFQQRRNVTML